MDFYPSNIMWAPKDDSFDVKIIDWDAAHREGEKFLPLTSDRIADSRRYPAWLPEVASTDHDLFFLQILRDHQTNVCFVSFWLVFLLRKHIQAQPMEY